LIYNCLQKYTQAPNSSSLDAHYEVPAEGIWNVYKKSQCRASNEDDPELLIRRKSRSNNGQTITESADPYDASSTSGQQMKSTETDPDTVDMKLEQKASSNTTSELLHPSELVRKLRWVSLGYQYNWSEKTYFFDRPIPVPEEAAKLSIAIAKTIEGIGYRQDDGFRWQNKYKGDNYAPEAGIVNYYQLKDTLMAHVDRSELNMEAPLISMR
jgi:alkylated DNA repair protein alkB homolog 1